MNLEGSGVSDSGGGGARDDGHPRRRRDVLVARAGGRRRRVHQQAADGQELEGAVQEGAGEGGGAARGDRHRAAARHRAGALLAATTGTSATGRRSTASPRRSCAPSSRPSPTTIRTSCRASGAQGLMQLHARDGAARWASPNSFDPRQNIMGGARYLQVLARRFCRTPAATDDGQRPGERLTVCSPDEKIKVIAALPRRARARSRSTAASRPTRPPASTSAW